MTHDELLTSVLGIVAGVAGGARTPAGASADTALRDGYWLDSMELLEVVLSCEAQFGVTFEASVDLTPEHLATVGTLAALVQRRLPGAGT